jgi:ABC-2 type transport system permease protein
MRKYLVIALKQFLATMSYKFNFVMGLISPLIMLFLTYWTWTAIYNSAGSTEIGGYTESEMLAYIIIANLTFMIFSFESVMRMSGMVRNGKLTVVLVRPISILGESVAVFVGQKLIFVGGYVVMIAVFYAAGFYPSIAYAGMMLLVFVVNFILFTLLVTLISLASFWVIQMWPLRSILNAVYFLLAGMYFPLDLLPDSIFSWLRYNPFSLIGHDMTKGLQGVLSLGELSQTLLAATVWILILCAMYAQVLKRGLHRYEGMGS